MLHLLSKIVCTYSSILKYFGVVYSVLIDWFQGRLSYETFPAFLSVQFSVEMTCDLAAKIGSYQYPNALAMPSPTFFLSYSTKFYYQSLEIQLSIILSKWLIIRWGQLTMTRPVSSVADGLRFSFLIPPNTLLLILIK